jgi:general secretion pathway protein H
MHRPALLRHRGFTLLEVLVVVALIATASTLLLGAMAGALPGQQLRDATGRMAAEMRATRARALATGRDQLFEIDIAGHRWQAGPAKSNLARSGAWPEAIDVSATAAREEQLRAETAVIRFFADGSSTGGRVVLRRGDAAWRIDVAWLTGTVRVERGEGER